MKSLKLIDGKFSAKEAKEILLNMINNKIQFHTNRDFSSEIRFGTPEVNSRERLIELRETKKKILSLLEEAKNNNQILRIHSSIEVTAEGENSSNNL